MPPVEHGGGEVNLKQPLIVYGQVKTGVLYAEVMTIIGSQQFHHHYATSPSDAEKLAAEIAQLFAEPSKLQTLMASIDVCLSKGYRLDIGLPYLLEESSKATLDDCYVELTLDQQEEKAARERALIQNNQKESDLSLDDEPLHRQDSCIGISALWQAATYRVRNANQDSKEPKLPRRLVVRGVAGAGKTTLLRCLAAQWGKVYDKQNQTPSPIDLTHWRETFCLLVHVRLRDLCVHALEETNWSNTHLPNQLSSSQHLLMGWLKEAFPDLQGAELIVLMLCLTRSDEMKPFLPRPVLLLLDGLDEVSELLEPHAHNPLKKQFEFLRVLLAHDYWLVTTRPHVAEDSKLATATYHLALNGFSSAQINNYVERFFSTWSFSPEEKNSIKQWLTQPDLQLLAKVPLQLELLCSVALDTLEQKKPLPQSGQGSDLTQLYTRMLVVLCRRYLAKYPELLLRGKKAQLAYLPEEILLLRCQDVLNWLSVCALEAMQRQQVVWRISTFRNAPSFCAKAKNLQTVEGLQQLEAAFDHFGLLTPMGIKKPNRLEQDYYFQHLTYQEFLAAYALARRLVQCSREQIELYIKEIDAPFCYRIQLFLVGLLSEPAVANIFLTQPEQNQGYAVVNELLNVAWKDYYLPLPNEKLTFERWRKRYNLASEPSFLHACRLLDSALASCHDALAKIQCADKVTNVLLDYLNAAMDAAKKDEHRTKIYYIPDKWDFLSKRLLDIPSIKIFLEETWNEHPLVLLQWLGKLGCFLPDFLEKIIMIAVKRADLQEAAVKTIGRLGQYASKRLKDAIEPLTSNADPNVKKAVAQAIGSLGQYAPEKLQLKLIDLIKDNEASVRKSAAWAIGRLGEHASESLKTSFKRLTDDPSLYNTSSVRKAVARAIGYLGQHASERLQLKLIDLIKDNEASVRQAATEAIRYLGKFANEALQAQLVVLLSDDHDAVQEAAAAAIARLDRYASETTKHALEGYRQRAQNENSSSAYRPF
ncbi:MAG: HEAT repeat domain-containing protein [Gammaproteobacteria bacterium]|nr:HEAT repeat domain-containing protein [Gammaproteobacteria bacterium]